MSIHENHAHNLHMLSGDALYRATDQSEAETVQQHLACMNEAQRASALVIVSALMCLG